MALREERKRSSVDAKWTEAKVAETPFGLPLWFHTIVFPLFIIVSTFYAAPAMFVICRHFNGDMSRFISEFNLKNLIDLWPTPTFKAFQIIWWFFVLELSLLLLVPGKKMLGPITPAGNQPSYKLNGVACYLLTHIILYIGSSVFGLYNLGIVYDHLGEILVSISYFSLFICFVLYLKGVYAPTNGDASVTGSFIMDFFWGVELHPSIFGVSLKQLANCRLGMMSWSPILWSYLFKQHEIYGHFTNSMFLSVFLQFAYIFKFYHWEGGYFGTMDIAHDRFGYYIYWGVTCWIPSCYTLTGMWLVEHPLNLSPLYFWSVFIFGLSAIYINYEADAQRQLVRKTGGDCKIWGSKPEMIVATYHTSDGQQRTNLLLVSGWWGVARHFHYVPELLLSLAWSLPAQNGGFLPYFYVTYLTILLVHRSGRDELRCSYKYGSDWEKYKARVPYRMIPGVY